MPEIQKETDYPIYVKIPAILLGLVLGVWILYVLGDILIPVAFAVLISILLNPPRGIPFPKLMEMLNFFTDAGVSGLVVV